MTNEQTIQEFLDAEKRLQEARTRVADLWPVFQQSLRQRKGYTQQQLAERAGVDISYICRLEKGRRPSSDIAAKILAIALED